VLRKPKTTAFATSTANLIDQRFPKVTTWAMTITFVRIPPTTIDQVKINPGGIYVKSFNVNQEQ
ncbi:VirB8/TrbF family protein, partial [Cupriavidus sp. AcVe19-6a]|uniref:VirB8/TrbF family protein n=1 Tax=Cupriavidus sp. AcVe19-6a TaxID=2821358 RepID=UPI001AE95D5C